MKTPVKLVIEITADGYSNTLLDEQGNEVWSDRHAMISKGRARREAGEDIFDAIPDEDDELAELAEAIDDMSFGPFGVACAFYSLREFEEL